MTNAEQDQLVDLIAGGIETVTAPLLKRICDLEVSLRDLKAKCMRYRGISQPGTVYAKGDAVTRRNSLWVVVADSTSAAPGSGEPGSNEWQQASRGER